MQSGADLRHLVAVIPVRSLEGAKSRLGGSLDAEERAVLATGLLERTIRAVAEVAAVESTVVVSPDPAVLRLATGLGATPVLQHDEGLNEGLRTAVRWAVADGATAVLVLAADLPGVSADAVAAVVRASATAVLSTSGPAGSPEMPGEPLVAIVTDRHGSGTNALLVSPADRLAFAFGPDSRALHRASAVAIGARVLELDGPLAFDVDLPEDLIRAEELGLLDPARGG